MDRLLYCKSKQLFDMLCVFFYNWDYLSTVILFGALKT